MARDQLPNGRHRSTSSPCSRPRWTGWTGWPSVGDGDGRFTLAGPLRGVEVADGRVDLLLHPRQGHDVEHGLTVAEDVDQLVAVAGEDRPVAVQHQVGRRQV